VLPVLHLNGYKIANPTVLARIPEAELAALMRGYGYEPHFVTATTARRAPSIAADPGRGARRHRRHPARGPSGGTGNSRTGRVADDRAAHAEGLDRPKEVDGLPVEGTFRAHQVPLAEPAQPEHRAMLEDWMRSYRPRSCSTRPAG
jgi:xylulose-5-phosphate/fructose-6-phosphate phosphoketolase